MCPHTNPEHDVLRVQSEVDQIRETQINVTREDATIAAFREMMGYDRVKRMNAYWFRVEETRDFSEIPGCATSDFRTDILAIIDRLRAAGLDRVLVVDLTDPELGVPVVRVVVPGLECFTIDNERRGKRCLDAERRRLHRSKSSV